MADTYRVMSDRLVGFNAGDIVPADHLDANVDALIKAGHLKPAPKSAGKAETPNPADPADTQEK